MQHDTGGGGGTGLSGVSNALLLAPAERKVCVEFATEFPAEQVRVLAVVYDDTAEEWVERWVDRAGSDPRRGGIVSVGETAESVESRETGEGVGQAWAVRTVTDETDLTGVGIEMSELLSMLTETADEDDPIVVCFDSVTALLQNATLEQAFRFFHVATGRVATGDALGRYHLDPAAHGEETLTTLAGLFDVVAEREDDGWTVDGTA